MELFLNPNPRKQFIVQKVTAVLRVGVWVLRMLSGCPIWECLVQVPAGLPITAGVDPGSECAWVPAPPQETWMEFLALLCQP